MWERPFFFALGVTVRSVVMAVGVLCLSGSCVLVY